MMKKQLTRSLFGVLAVSPLVLATLGAQASPTAPRQPLIDAQGAPAPGNVGQAGRPANRHRDPLGPDGRPTLRPPTAAELRAAGVAPKPAASVTPKATAPLLRMTASGSRPAAAPLRATTGEPMPGNCMGKGGRGPCGYE